MGVGVTGVIVVVVDMVVDGVGGEGLYGGGMVVDDI